MRSELIGVDPRARRRLVVAGLAVLLVATLVVCLVAPEAARAALQSAAGDRPGAGGFARFVRFVNRLADYTIPVGAAFAVLGLVWAGLLFQAGDSRAGRMLGFVVLGAG